MKEHECIIGLMDDYENTANVTLTELKEYIKFELDAYKTPEELEEVENYWCYSTSKPYILEDYLDLRKHTNFFHYAYCPICGKKIDWAKLRKENK